MTEEKIFTLLKTSKDLIGANLTKENMEAIEKIIRILKNSVRRTKREKNAASRKREPLQSL